MFVGIFFWRVRMDLDFFALFQATFSSLPFLFFTVLPIFALAGGDTKHDGSVVMDVLCVLIGVFDYVHEFGEPVRATTRSAAWLWKRRRIGLERLSGWVWRRLQLR